jgi:SAM-dependent methyltransferase
VGDVSWSNLTEWWLAELRQDHAYDQVVSPLLFEVLRPVAGDTYLDLGCGEGRVMRSVEEMGAHVVGIDLNLELGSQAGVAVIAELPEIPMRHGSVDGAYSVLTLEHIAPHETFFRESARVVRPGGVLAIVINHPIWTAPGSTPITDADGEVLWRPGGYFGTGFTDEPAGGSKVRFHHRSMAELMNSAAGVGWCLEAMVERPHHDLPDQVGIPRLLAVRWRGTS